MDVVHVKAWGTLPPQRQLYEFTKLSHGCYYNAWGMVKAGLSLEKKIWKIWKFMLLVPKFEVMSNKTPIVNKLYLNFVETLCLLRRHRPSLEESLSLFYHTGPKRSLALPVSWCPCSRFLISAFPLSYKSLPQSDHKLLSPGACLFRIISG